MQKNNKNSLIWLSTPLNLEEEKEKFFASHTYNPKFRYIWQEEKSPHDHLGRKADLFKAMKLGDGSHIVEMAKQYFETEVDPKLIKEAKSQVSLLKPKCFDTDVKKLKAHFKNVLAYFDLNFELEVTKTGGFNIRPGYTQNKIYLGADIRADFMSIDGLVKHEMVHVARFVNGRKNKISFRNGFLPTDEGLASFFQDYYTKDGESSLFQHSAEYVATSLGVKGSLRDIYDYFKELKFPNDLAWQRAARHKYGFVDTSQPGDFIKPAMYYYHEQKIKKLDQDRLLNLFSGKVSIKDIDKYPYQGLDEEKLKNYFFKF